MKIISKNNELIIRIPLTQKESNIYMSDGDLCDVPNLLGIIAGDEYTLSQANDMSYAGKPQQEGMPILHFYDKEELIEICKKYNINIREYPLCDYCHKAIRGSFTMGKKGNMCFECELKKEV